MPKFRRWRACFYVAFGLSSIVFVVHGLLVYGWEVQKSRMSLVWMGWMAIANLAGVLIYAARVRVFPITNDLDANYYRFPRDMFPIGWMYTAPVIRSSTSLS